MSATDSVPHPAIDPARLREAASLAVGTLKLLANEDRLLLLCQLSQGERCVGDLEAELGILRNQGVVNTRREGKNIYYSVASPELLEILGLLYRLYCPQDDTGAAP